MYGISTGPFAFNNRFVTSNDGALQAKWSVFRAEVISVTVKRDLAVVLTTAGAAYGDSVNNDDPDDTVNW
jgi:hypothetical protein